MDDYKEYIVKEKIIHAERGFHIGGGEYEKRVVPMQVYYQETAKDWTYDRISAEASMYRKIVEELFKTQG